MFTFLLRRKAAVLIWQYLDGVIPPDRLELLQRLLFRHTAVRRQFVDCAMLNALLFAYFNPGRYAAVPSIDGHPMPREADALEAELARLYKTNVKDANEPCPRQTKRPAG